MSVADRLTTAATLLEDGQTVTLSYPEGSTTYDPATGSSSGTTPDDESVAGVILPLTDFRKANGSVVEGDQELFLAAQNIAGTAIATPVVNGTITDVNNAKWTIIAVEPLAPAGLNILFECIIRRAM